MVDSGRKLKVFAGSSCPNLAKEIAKRLDTELGEIAITKFSDGETYANIKETVRGMDVFIIQSTADPVNENIMELLIMIDAFKRASAGRITAVIPYYGYARQDRKTKPREPISAKLVADLIVAAGANRVLTMDLHAPQLQGFFNIPVDHLQGVPILIKHYLKSVKDFNNIVIASPDIGSVTRARYVGEKLDAPIAIVDKRRQKANCCEVMNIIGDVKGKTVIMVDDLIDTAGTVVNAAKALMDMGAKEILACCTHAVLSGQAIDRIENSKIKELIVLNTIELPEKKQIEKIKVLSVGEVFAEAIKRISTNQSVSELFG